MPGESSDFQHMAKLSELSKTCLPGPQFWTLQ